MANDKPWRHRDERPNDLGSLLDRLLHLQRAEDAPRRGDGVRVTYAFRGIGSADWKLEPTLVHTCRAQHDAGGLRKEKDLVTRFRVRAWRFLGAQERAFLGVSVADTVREDPTNRELQWDQPHIWAALAIARHYGVPTRLLDWTRSAVVAAYFAACRKPKTDGAVWWFDQSSFEDVLSNRWDLLHVPRRTDNSGERALELKAFGGDATGWVSKIHHGVPFHRMDVQQGFFTVCGRLDKSHDDAVDELLPEIPRGRVIVSASLKRDLLDVLERMGVHAQAIDYPGADLIGSGIFRACVPGNRGNAT